MEPIATSSISHIIYPVKNLDETIAFYTQNLGFKVLRRYSSGAGRESAYLELGGVLLEMGERPDAAPPSANGRLENRIGLTVSDLDKCVETLKARGVEMEDESYEARTFWGRQCKIKDPSGYSVTLREWLEPDGPTYPDWKPRHEGMTRTG